MEAEDRGLLDEWMRNWENLTEFEVLEVMTSSEESEKVGNEKEGK